MRMPRPTGGCYAMNKIDCVNESSLIIKTAVELVTEAVSCVLLYNNSSNFNILSPAKGQYPEELTQSNSFL